MSVLCTVMGLASVAQAAEGVCPLRVNDESGVQGPWPLVGGLPIPRGVVTKPEQVRIINPAGDEVPAQVDVAATYQDGSIRWALISLMGSPTDEYKAEFGEDIRRVPAAGITVGEKDEGIVLDTGAARFTISRDNLLADSAVLNGEKERPLWGAGEHRAYLVDNRGRTAMCGGPQAEIEIVVLKAGPIRCVVRTEGWYVTEQGERVARGIARMSFFAGSSMVKISHTLVFTEDTNELWIRDYGIQVPLPAEASAEATFDFSQAFDKHVAAAQLEGDDVACMLQSEFPHFAERESKFTVTMNPDAAPQRLTEGEACGEWCDLTSGTLGVTVVVRDFAEQFPKEFEASRNGIRVHLWPQRSGKELDFRAETLVRDYWQSWADLAPGGAGALAKVKSNAQGAAKTHELWIMPHAGRWGGFDPDETVARAHAVCRPALLQADPKFLCASGALPWPLHPKDTKRFPAEEAMISDFWDRLVFPYRVFPMTGVISWGCNPYLRYVKREGRWYSDFYRISGLIAYGIRRHVWNLYARSGERKYYQYGTRFNKYAGDWEMTHWDAGEKTRGGFARSHHHQPFPWGSGSQTLETGVSGSDLRNFSLEYYLTGDEAALEPIIEFGDAVKKTWDLQQARKSSSPFLILRLLTALYTREWDEDFREMAHDLAHLIIDMDSPNGLTNDMPYGALYKVDRNASALYDYWWATGDELAKQAFLKALDYQYRFNRVPTPIAYQNGAAYLFTIAYEMTGREEYRRMVNQLVQTGLVVENKTIAEEIGDQDPYALDRLPYRGVHLNMHPTLGMPTALTLLAKAEEPIPPYPMLVKPFTAERAYAVFEKPPAKPVEVRMFFSTQRQGDVTPTVFGPDGEAVNAAIQVEERLTYSQTRDSTTDIGPTEFRRFSVLLTLPGEAPAGVYRIDFRRRQGYGGQVRGSEEFIILHANVEKVALACPDGFWTGGGGLAAGAPAFFEVPQGTDKLELFVGRPQTIYRPDGSVALEATEGNIGDISIPVQGDFGAWKVQSPYPAHLKLRNVPKVVAFGDPARLVRLDQPLPEPAAPKLPSPEEQFVAGVIGQALQLVEGRTLKFPRGDQLEDGSYQHFPANEGTIELWFRPNWSSNALTFKHRQLLHLNFVDGGSISFYYRYGQGPVTANLYSYVDLLTRGPLGKPGRETDGHIGGHARHFFRAGEWGHLAATWKIGEGERGTEGTFWVFVNGEPMAATWNYPRSLDGRQPYRLRETSETITLGCPDGCIDELRISRVVRYEGAFEPPKKALEGDADTLALFHFDGDTQGVSGPADEVIVAE